MKKDGRGRPPKKVPGDNSADEPSANDVEESEEMEAESMDAATILPSALKNNILASSIIDKASSSNDANANATLVNNTLLNRNASLFSLTTVNQAGPSLNLNRSIFAGLPDNKDSLLFNEKRVTFADQASPVPGANSTNTSSSGTVNNNSNVNTADFVNIPNPFDLDEE